MPPPVSWLGPNLYYLTLRARKLFALASPLSRGVRLFTHRSSRCIRRLCSTFDTSSPGPPICAPAHAPAPSPAPPATTCLLVFHESSAIAASVPINRGRPLSRKVSKKLTIPLKKKSTKVTLKRRVGDEEVEEEEEQDQEDMLCLISEGEASDSVRERERKRKKEVLSTITM